MTEKQHTPTLGMRDVCRKSNKVPLMCSAQNQNKAVFPRASEPANQMQEQNVGKKSNMSQLVSN
jgi:hypothetical protein